MTNMFYNCSNFSQSLREWELSINTILNNTTNMFSGANTTTSLGGITIIDVTGTPIMLPVDQTVIDQMSYFLKTNIFYANNLNFKSAISYYFDTSSIVPNIFSTTELINIGKFDDPITKNNISYWDVTAVVNMADAFLNKATFNVDINGWDVSSVTNMSGMFSGCLNFNK